MEKQVAGFSQWSFSPCPCQSITWEDLFQDQCKTLVGLLDVNPSEAGDHL